MKTNTITKTAAPALFLIACVLLPQTAHCFYNASTGRWLSRDPIAERGGNNLCQALRNDPINRLDPLGTKCCTCVTSLEIQDVKPVNYQDAGLTIYGHSFNVVMGLEYVECGGAGDATLEWKEKSNHPPIWYGKDARPGEWIDVNTILPLWFPAWLDRKKPCPGTEPVTLPDKPQQATISLSRTINFRITVRSANNCTKCTIKSLTVTAKQVLAASSDSPHNILTQDFISPDPDPSYP